MVLTSWQEACWSDELKLVIPMDTSIQVANSVQSSSKPDNLIAW